MSEQAWAAGFLLGEGHVSRYMVEASQKSREPLERLAGIFGGTITAWTNVRTGRSYWRWRGCGDTARAAKEALCDSALRCDVAWVAGFMEAEGHFCRHRRHHNRGKSATGQTRQRRCTENGGLLATACQVNAEPLVVLRDRFGGSLRPKRYRDHRDQWVWATHGERARAVMDAVYDEMSSRRREQIDRALGA